MDSMYRMYFGDSEGRLVQDGRHQDLTVSTPVLLGDNSFRFGQGGQFSQYKVSCIFNGNFMSLFDDPSNTRDFERVARSAHELGRADLLMTPLSA